MRILINFVVGKGNVVKILVLYEFCDFRGYFIIFGFQNVYSEFNVLEVNLKIKIYFDEFILEWGGYI